MNPMRRIMDACAAFLLIFGSGLWTVPVWSASSGTRIVEYQGAPVTVRLAVSQAGAIEFPEEIADAFTALTAEHIAIDYRTNVLYLQPLQELDGTVFVDAGQVAARRQDFRFNDFDVSYGVGFRIHSNSAFVARLDLAFSREGFIPLLRFEHAF